MKLKHKKEIEERFFKFDINSESFNNLILYPPAVLWWIGLCLFYYDVSHHQIEIYKDQPIVVYYSNPNNNISYVTVNLIIYNCYLFYNEAKT